MKASPTACIGLVAILLIAISGTARGEGFQLGEDKEELELEYELVTKAHRTGRVSFTLTIADEGRLKPLSTINLVIGNTDETNYVDLSVVLETKEFDGKKQVHVHLLRELAERAEIHLRTATFDGKREPLTWYFHSISLGDALKAHQNPREPPQPADPKRGDADPPPPAATKS